MVAERVVDVLEVIEIDIEHRRGQAAGADVADRLFEPLAEIDAVGQAADRIVQREVAQFPLAVGERRIGAPDHARDQNNKQRVRPSKRNGDERQHALDDAAGRQHRPESDAGDGSALGVGERGDALVGGRRAVARVRAGRRVCSRFGDLGEQPLVDEFHAENDRRAFIAAGEVAVGTDCDRDHDGGIVAKALDQRSAAARRGRELGRIDRDGVAGHRGEPSAQQIDQRREFGTQIGDAAGDVGGEMAVFDRVVGAGDRDHIVIEIGEGFADAAIDPGGVVIVADIGGGLRSWR